MTPAQNLRALLESKGIYEQTLRLLKEHIGLKENYFSKYVTENEDYEAHVAWAEEAHKRARATAGKQTLLYHSAPPEYRKRIMKLGLQHPYQMKKLRNTDHIGAEIDAAGIYFTDTKPDDPRYDTWAVDVRGLTLEPDETTDWPYPETWWFTYDQVGPERLKLIQAGIV